MKVGRRRSGFSSLLLLGGLGAFYYYRKSGGDFSKLRNQLFGAFKGTRQRVGEIAPGVNQQSRIGDESRSMNTTTSSESISPQVY